MKHAGAQKHGRYTKQDESGRPSSSLWPLRDHEAEGIVASQRTQCRITPEWIEEHVAQMEAEALAQEE